MSFHPVLPTSNPLVTALAQSALVEEADARSALVHASSGAAAPPGELVVWAWTFDPLFRFTLVVDHPRFGCLLPPGGRVELGEDPRLAALRELREETGLVTQLIDDRPALVDVVRGTTADGGAFQTFGLAFVAIADRTAGLEGEPGQPPSWVAIDSCPKRANERHWQRITAYVRNSR